MVVLILMRKKSSESCGAQKEPGQDIYGVNPTALEILTVVKIF